MTFLSAPAWWQIKTVALIIDLPPMTHPQQLPLRWWRACGWVWQCPVRRASQMDACWWDDFLFSFYESLLPVILCTRQGELTHRMFCFIIWFKRWHIWLVAMFHYCRHTHTWDRMIHTGRKCNNVSCLGRNYILIKRLFFITFTF